MNGYDFDWYCFYDVADPQTSIQINADVTAVRAQFGTARGPDLMAVTQADVLWQLNTDKLDGFRWALQGLFEYSNDQLVYRNALEVPEERTNLIPTAKAPGVF